MVLDSSFPNFPSHGSVFCENGVFHVFLGEPIRSQLRPSCPAVFLNDFFLNQEKPWRVYPSYEKKGPQGMGQCLSSMSRGLSDSGILSEASLPNASLIEDGLNKKILYDFEAQFNFVKRAISTGRVQKAVTYCFHPLGPPAMSLPIRWVLFALQKQQQLVREGFYCVWSPEEFSLGVSPEILLAQKGLQSLETMALAGTRTWTDYLSNPEEFLNDPKEAHEHDIVVQFLQATLASFGSVTSSRRKVVQAGALAHLQTKFSVELNKDLGLDEVIAGLHPTPALGCEPRTYWKKLLKEMDSEPMHRGPFGAPVGYSLSPEHCEIRVAIRGLLWQKGLGVSVGTGCGVVAGSQLEKEWVELLNKKKATLKGLGF